MLKLSIIIPVYNSEKTIERAVQSVLRDKNNEFELIIVNDGSTDNSLKICKGYARHDVRVNVIDSINAGVSSARNIGINAAKGIYITFLDSDDYYSENSVSTMISKLNSKTEFMIFSYISENSEGRCIKKNTIYEDTITTASDCYSVFAELIRNEMMNSPWNKVYSREIIISNRISFPLKYDIGEDILFNLKYIRNITSVKLCSDSLVHYVVTKNQGLVSKFRSNRLEIRLYIIDRMIELMKYWGIYNELNKKNMNDMIIRDIYGYFMDFNKKACGFGRKQKMNEIRNTLSNHTVKKALVTKNGNPFMRLLRYILKTKQTSVILLVSKVLYYIRR